MSKTQLVTKAKLIYYLNSINKKYYEDNYTMHLKEMLNVLRVFKVNDQDYECGVWLYNTCRYPKTLVINEFGDRVFNMVFDTALQYNIAAKNKDAVILLMCDRIAHVNYFLENGKKSAYNLFFEHHDLFRKNLYKKGHCDSMWAYLDTLMEKDWDNLMCV